MPVRLSFLLLPPLCLALHWLATLALEPRATVPGCALAFLLHLSSVHLALELLVKSQSRGSVRLSTRGAHIDVGTRLVVVSKRLQGFHPDHLFEYSHIGLSAWGYLPVLLAWLLAVPRAHPVSHLHAVAAATALTALCWLAPFHLIALAYTGRDGDIHGFGLNIYATLSCGGRRFEGERFFAMDWHQEKLAERGPDGRWLPRAQQRTVLWPHLHLCFRRLEFWPWVLEPTDAMADAMADAQRRRGEARAEKAQRPVAAGVLVADLQSAVDRAERGACSGFASLGLLLASRAASDDAQDGGLGGAEAQDTRLRRAGAQLSQQLASQAADEVAARLAAEERGPVLEAAAGLAGRRVGQAIGEARRQLAADYARCCTGGPQVPASPK